MKKLLLLFISIVFTAQTSKAQTVVLDSNGVTIKWTGTTVPSPYFVQANPRGTGMEWFAIVDNSTRNNITNYAKNIQSGITFFTRPSTSAPIPFNNIVTTLVTNMSSLFENINNFNQAISSWDLSNATVTNKMFKNIGGEFNLPIGSWNVSNVSNMSEMFFGASGFNQSISSWNVGRVILMNFMFYSASSFNQNISSWNVGNVTSMASMFNTANFFNQPLGTWNVSNVTDMSGMFANATRFNQLIDSWNVSNVTDMNGMFGGARAFNQNIGNWNVSRVNNMFNMFNNASAFNQPIGNWNVTNVTNMMMMFSEASSFNQPISSWNVGNVTTMESMFFSATTFNQPIGSWRVGRVTTMTQMLQNSGLSTANFDNLLIGWAALISLNRNVRLDVSSHYCNGESARSYLYSQWGWNVSCLSRNCSSLDTETFETNSFKLYPNPVLNVLNIKADNNFINQLYTIIDSMGRVVLNGKLNEVDNAINIEQLSEGIYYIKVAGNNSTKFIKL